MLYKSDLRAALQKTECRYPCGTRSSEVLRKGPMNFESSLQDTTLAIHITDVQNAKFTPFAEYDIASITCRAWQARIRRRTLSMGDIQ